MKHRLGVFVGTAECPTAPQGVAHVNDVQVKRLDVFDKSVAAGRRCLQVADGLVGVAVTGEEKQGTVS